MSKWPPFSDKPSECGADPGRSAAGRLVAIVVLAVAAGTLLADPKAQRETPSTTPAAIKHPVLIRKPEGKPHIATGRTNFSGQPVFVSCGSCHTTTKPNPELRSSNELDQFHQGMRYDHGQLTCLSCHNAGNYESLRMADGRSLHFDESMTLCSQCHGPQKRDYDQGLHGGMTGHWDLARGGRERNTCVNCHDPHAPAFPLVIPVLPPKDRISVPRENTNPTASH